MTRLLTTLCLLTACVVTLRADEGVEPAAATDKPATPTVEALQKRIEALEKQNGTKTITSAGLPGPVIRWSGQFQSDAYIWTQDAVSRASVGDIQNGVAFRRARLAINGDYGPTEFRIEGDMALAGRPSFLDVFAGIKTIPGVGQVRVGHFFEPFSLERYTANRFVTFLERGLQDQPFAPARNMGVLVRNTYAGQRGTWAVGVFRTDSDIFGDDSGDQFQSAVTGRVTGLVYDLDQSTRYLHLGVAGSYRGTKDGTVRFRAQPEARLGSTTPNVPFFVDTGNIAAGDYSLLGLEALLTEGSVSVQGEWIGTAVGTARAGNLLFQAWYATATWLITGEHRPYRHDNGTYERTVPNRDFVRTQDGRTAFGPGAWELALRLSHIDLDSGSVRGGRLTDLTAGVNWYLNPYLRVSANYIHAFPAASNLKPNARGQTDAFAARVSFEF